MDEHQPRKKQPEKVKRALLDCAAQLAAQEGLSGVTIQAVAKAAGVTKGGLFHHYPNKQTLIEALFDDMLEHLDAHIESFIDEGSAEHGCFTRAYVKSVFADPVHTAGSQWGDALPISVIADQELKRRWDNWLANRMRRHAQTDDTPLLEVVRRATDGIWFDALLARRKKIDHLSDLLPYLLALTHKDAAVTLPCEATSNASQHAG